MTKTILATSLLFFFISCSNKEIKKTPISSTNETEINLETEEQNTESFEHEIDKRFDDCINENDCTACYGECTVTAIKEWRSEMNKYYNLLLENLDESTKEKLILSQKKWLEYSEFELQFSNEFYGNMSGTIWGGVGLRQSLNKIKSRALELKAHYGAITGDAVRRPS